MIIGLNPSTANENTDDPTIRRLKSIMRYNGFGGFYMLNLFTYITAYSSELIKYENRSVFADGYLRKYSDKCEKIIFAWGNFKEAEERGREVMNMFDGYVFGLNKNGSPKHPLYLKTETKLIEYKP